MPPTRDDQAPKVPPLAAPGTVYRMFCVCGFAVSARSLQSVREAAQDHASYRIQQVQG